jgi:outer membrane lipoprotein-sorting protein
MRDLRLFFFSLGILAYGLLIFACQGCLSRDDSALRVKEYYSGLSSMKLLAAVSADYGDYTADFELAFSFDSEGESRVEVKKPAEIEGVKVLFGENGVSLEYEGVSLELARPEDTIVSPAAVLPELFHVWSDGVVSEYGSEKVGDTDCLRIAYKSGQDENEILYLTWFNGTDLKPLKAEIFAEGKKKIDCEFLIAENFG